MKILHCVFERIKLIVFVFLFTCSSFEVKRKGIYVVVGNPSYSEASVSVLNLIARMRKTTISCVVSVRPSVRM